MKKNLPLPAVIAIVVVLLVGLFVAFQRYSSDNVYTGSKRGYGKDNLPPPPSSGAPPTPVSGQPSGQ